jgi:hypothetical protein
LREGFENDDIWMMVEDEFQALAQSFTAHLHRAEYKRLMKKAKDAPPKPLPEPTSPMSKETQRMLQRRALVDKQNKALECITAASEIERVSDDADEEKVEDSWRGTALAGLMALGSQEKTSLKGLEKLPSSTRAAQGFPKAVPKSSTRTANAIDELTGLRAMLKDSHANDISERGQQKSPQQLDASSKSLNESKGYPDEHPATSRKRNTARSAPAKTTSRPPRPPLLNREKLKEESKEDRLAEVPMFLV